MADISSITLPGGGTYDLKDKKAANQAQLATVESGSTASRAYAIGECFTLNGKLYEVTYPITTGGSFVVNANCKEIMVGDNLVGRPSTVSKAYFDKDTGYFTIHLRMKDNTHQMLEVHEEASSSLVMKTFNGSAWATKWSLPTVLHKEVVLTTTTIGTSFSPTSRMIGDSTTLFGVPAAKILSINIRDGSLSPASILIWGFYSNNFYLAATQQCTLNSNPTFAITYIP